MFGDVVMEIPKAKFDKILTARRKRAALSLMWIFTAEDLKEVISQAKSG